MSQARADFSRFRSAEAFPGRIASSWGACLVEPPEVGALRQVAGGRLVELGDLAPPHSGIPTRVVAYFCLEQITDASVQARMGIRSQRDRQRLTVVKDGRGAVHILERDALKPMLRRPGDLEGKLDVTEQDTAPWKMLYLHIDKSDLEFRRWNHTLAYIRYGETQNFPGPEGSRRAGGIPAERPQVRVRPVWFQVAKIPVGPGRVSWLKGRGDRHYVPVLAESLLIPDNFLYSAPPKLIVPRAFSAVCNLSWTHLMAEIFGRRGGGDGVLHTYIRELSMLPIIDPRKFGQGEAEDFVELFDVVAARPALPINEEMQQPDRQKFDRWAMRYLFENEAEGAASAVERALRGLVEERFQRAASGREQEQRATRRSVFDPAPIAARVLMDCGMPTNIATMVGELDSTLDSLALEIPAHSGGMVEVGSTLLDAGDVVVGGHVLLSTPSDSHSLAVVALLTTNNDYSGIFTVPLDSAATAEIYRSWHSAWSEWKESAERAVRVILPRPQQAERRRQVTRELEERTGLPRDLLSVYS
jgi:hypothetical protein